MTNACSCDLHSGRQSPSGCIVVWESRFQSWEGVNDVLVDFAGPHFSHSTSMTDRNGCFRSWYMPYIQWTPFGDIRYPVQMSVHFISDRKEIRLLDLPGTDGLLPSNYGLPLSMWWGGTLGNWRNGLNNIRIEIPFSNTGDFASALYTSATVNNAIYDYDTYAETDNILRPFPHMRVMVNPYMDNAGTPMFHQQAVTGSALYWTAAPTLTALAGTFLPYVGTAMMGIIVANPCDIYYGYAFNSAASFQTDQLKETMYHELGHASHHAKAGNALWQAEITYVVNEAIFGDGPAPYGDGLETNAGTCALIESWGYYIGRAYAHRRYGGNRHSRNNPATFDQSWRARNEQDRLLADEFIPSGLIHDLLDVNASNPVGINENPAVRDSIGNFGRSQIFNQMGPGTQNIQDLRVKLRALGITTGGTNTVAKFDTLMADYGL